MELDECVNFLLSVSQHTVFQHLSEKLLPYNITPAQYGVLNCLWKEKYLTPKEIGEKLHLEASSVSSILDKMQKNSLIERNIDPNNRRTIIVSATQKAIDIQKPIEKIILEMNNLMLEPFSDTEKKFLVEALQTIIRRNYNK